MKYFKYTQYSFNKLISLKKQRKLRIGVALPVCNEEGTLENTIKMVKRCGALVDEVIVVDSNSYDKSKIICNKQKIPVIEDTKVARDLGIRLSRGKGWNLWSSLFYLTTDIIIWIDSDIQNIDRRFIIGIAGPLITNKKMKFVKGYYLRPKGDARVTEILARPFLNYIFPKTKYFIQPLSGEYGGTRDFLERCTFYSKYGVEVALLIQATYGLDANSIGQSFLGKRIHKLQEVPDLGKMGGNILSTLIDIARNMKFLNLRSKPKRKLRQFSINSYGQYRKIDYNVNDIRLPKMNQVKNYIKKFIKSSPML